MNYCTFSFDTNGATGESRFREATAKATPPEGVDLHGDATRVTIHVDDPNVARRISDAFLDLARKLEVASIKAAT